MKKRCAGEATSSRTKIFEATIDVARQVGAARVTLEAIARHAAISKGGLLYHFDTKIHLFEAMLRHFSLDATCDHEKLAMASLISAAHDPKFAENLVSHLEYLAAHREQLSKAYTKS